MNPPNKPVDVGTQIIISALVPFGVFYTTYRIKKLRKYLLVFIGEIVLNGIIGSIIPYEHLWAILLVIDIAINIYCTYKWSKEWNENVRKEGERYKPGSMSGSSEE